MVTVSRKIKLGLCSVVLGFMLLTSAAITSAEASVIKASVIKNGLACKKLGQTTKSGSKRYVCGKNPYVTPSKLTWMLRECPQTFELYSDSKDQYEIFKDILSSSGADGMAEAEKLLKGISDLEVLMKTQVCKKGK
jgi:hypothetical protein